MSYENAKRQAIEFLSRYKLPETEKKEIRTILTQISSASMLSAAYQKIEAQFGEDYSKFVKGLQPILQTAASADAGEDLGDLLGAGSEENPAEEGPSARGRKGRDSPVREPMNERKKYDLERDILRTAFYGDTANRGFLGESMKAHESEGRIDLQSYLSFVNSWEDGLMQYLSEQTLVGMRSFGLTEDQKNKLAKAKARLGQMKTAVATLKLTYQDKGYVDHDDLLQGLESGIKTYETGIRSADSLWKRLAYNLTPGSWTQGMSEARKHKSSALTIFGAGALLGATLFGGCKVILPKLGYSTGSDLKVEVMYGGKTKWLSAGKSLKLNEGDTVSIRKVSLEGKLVENPVVDVVGVGEPNDFKKMLMISKAGNYDILVTVPQKSGRLVVSGEGPEAGVTSVDVKPTIIPTSAPEPTAIPTEPAAVATQPYVAPTTAPQPTAAPTKKPTKPAAVATKKPTVKPQVPKPTPEEEEEEEGLKKPKTGEEP